MMSREALPLIGSSGSKTAAPPLSSPAVQARRRKRGQQQPSSSPSSSSSRRPPGPSSILLRSDSTMTPWGALSISESSFASILPPPPPPRPSPPPPPPPAPQPMPSTPCFQRQSEDGDDSGSSFSSDVPFPPAAVPQDSAGSALSSGGAGRGQRGRRWVAPQHWAPRPPRLPPLRPITNLSFSRSFTFSFFELPLHQSPRCRAERVKNLTLLLRQIHY